MTWKLMVFETLMENVDNLGYQHYSPFSTVFSILEALRIVLFSIVHFGNMIRHSLKRFNFSCHLTKLLIKPLPDHIILDWTKLKALNFVDDNFSMAQMLQFFRRLYRNRGKCCFQKVSFSGS